MPYAGYGMNAGIADATNLAWLLAAVPARLGRPGHPRTRMRPNGCRSPSRCPASPWTWPARCWASAAPCPTKSSSQAPRAMRFAAQVGQAAYDFNVQQYCCGGLNFGYFYDRSPIIAYDGAEQPAYTMADFTPSTVPGCRAPIATACGRTPGLRRLRAGLHPAAAGFGHRDRTARRSDARRRDPASKSIDLRSRPIRSPALRSQADPGPNRPARGLARRCRSREAEALVDTLRGLSSLPIGKSARSDRGQPHGVPLIPTLSGNGRAVIAGR